MKNIKSLISDATNTLRVICSKTRAINFGDIKIEGIPEKNPAAIRIMSCNLRYRDDEKGSVRNRSQISTAIIRQYSPDSFGVQEATGRWLDILDKSLGDKYAYIGQARDTQGYNSERSAVFYLKNKYTPVDSGTIWLSETPEIKYTKSFGSNCFRIATWVTLENKESGERYTHLNTHLDHILEETRVAQADVLINKLKELQKYGKVICTGDFNADNDSEVYTKMNSVVQDTRTVAKVTDKGITYHDYGNPTDEYSSAIDYIFVPKGTEVDKYKIIRNTVKKMYPSDHYPIVADIIL